jgi:hypothetical protein
MARDLVFLGVNVLGKNELEHTYKRLYLKKFIRGKASEQPQSKEDGREDEGRGREGTDWRRGKGGKGKGGHGRGRKGQYTVRGCQWRIHGGWWGFKPPMTGLMKIFSIEFNMVYSVLCVVYAVSLAQ